MELTPGQSGKLLALMADPRFEAAATEIRAAIAAGRVWGRPDWGDGEAWQLWTIGQYGETFTTAGPGGDGDDDGDYDGEDTDTTPVSGFDVVEAGAPVVVTLGLGALVARLGATMGARVWAAIRPLAVAGLVKWGALPGWVRTALALMGISAGTDLALDLATGTNGNGGGLDLWPFGGLGEGDTVEVGMRTYTVASTWTANGITFYRFRDGHLGVRNKHGVWKVWRPRKPIVLYPDGAGDFRTVLRADRIIAKTGADVARLLRRRGYRVSRKGE